MMFFFFFLGGGWRVVLSVIASLRFYEVLSPHK